MAQKQIQHSLRDIRNRIDQLFNRYQTQPDSPVQIDTFFDDLSGILAEFQVAGGETGLADLAKFLEENPGPVMRIDRDGTILYANSASSIILREWDRQIGQQMPREWASRIRKVARLEYLRVRSIRRLPYAPYSKEGWGRNFPGRDADAGRGPHGGSPIRL